MADWPTSVAILPQIDVVTSFSPCSLGMEFEYGGAPSANVNWVGANRAYYIPFILSEPVTAAFMFLANGNATSGNVDVGIYDRFGVKLVSSGSTAQGSTSIAKSFNIADTVIPEGLNYFAVAIDNTTARVSAAQSVRGHHGVYQEDSAFPLPTNATMTVLTNAGVVPLVGFTRRTIL